MSEISGSAPSAPAWLHVAPEVREALVAGRPVVALESTVIAHGLPSPRNREVAHELESIVREEGAVPATVAVVDGVPTVGITREQIDNLAIDGAVAKLSTRDLPVAMARGAMGATTVAATARLARLAGIDVFATGGIGGVHRGYSPPDVSADLIELARTRILVVCAGAKSILDLPATREALETLGVLVLGWQTSRFPAFYTRDSGLAVDAVVEDATEAAAIWREQQRLEAPGAVLLTVPVPADSELPLDVLEGAIDRAMKAAAAREIAGKEITPYLLAALATATEGSSLEANVALLRNNVAVAAAVARGIRQP